MGNKLSLTGETVTLVRREKMGGGGFVMFLTGRKRQQQKKRGLENRGYNGRCVNKGIRKADDTLNWSVVWLLLHSKSHIFSHSEARAVQTQAYFELQNQVLV